MTCALVLVAGTTIGSGHPVAGAFGPDRDALPSPRISLMLPRPIDTDDLDFIASTLQLSEEQIHFLTILHGIYVEERERVYREVVRPVYEQSAQILQRGNPGYDADVAESVAELFGRPRDRAKDALLRVDEFLLQQLIAGLSDEQATAIDVVRRYRARHLYDRPAQYPGADCDLCALLMRELLAGRLDDADWDREPIERLLVQYDHRATPLFRQRFQAILDQQSRGPVLFAHMQELGMAGQYDAPEMAELREEHRRIRRRVLESERAIHDLNARTAKAIARHMPKDDRDAFVATVRRKMYPEMYRDHGFLPVNAVLRQAEDAVHLDDDGRDLVRAIRMDYAHRIDALRTKTIETYRDRRAHYVMTRTAQAAWHAETQSQLQGFRAAARQLQRDALMTVIRQFAEADPNIELKEESATSVEVLLSRLARMLDDE